VDLDDRQQCTGAQVERFGQLQARDQVALGAVPASRRERLAVERPDERGDGREGRRQILIITCLTTV
jgi:hypothetical protein